MTSKKILLKNAFIHPIVSSAYNGDVLIEDGKIIDVGKNLIGSFDAKILDCSNLYLLPGFIDVHTHLGIHEEGVGADGSDANDTLEAINPHFRALDGINPFDPAFEDARQAGITTVHVMPGSSNIIGGTTSVIKTSGRNIQNMILQETAGLKIALGENPKRYHSYGNKDILTRMGIIGRLREIFIEARYSDSPHSLRLAPILQALNKEIPVRIHAHRADDILSALRFAEEFDLDLRIEHCTEGHLIADELINQNLKVSVGPSLTRKSKIELKNKSWITYHKLREKGIEVSITTDHPYTPIQYLNICAALAVREGLTVQDGLEGLTILPARNLRLEKRIGSIEKGKDADLVLWSHHPFHFMAKPKWTMINGNFVYIG